MPGNRNNRHKKDHGKLKPAKPFKCDVYDCGETFSTAGTKQRHAKQFHSEEGAYVCSRCSRDCARSDRLKLHESLCKKLVECLAKCMDGYTEPPPDSYFDIQQSNRTPGPASYQAKSTRPESQAQGQQYAFSPPTSQGSASPAPSYLINNKGPHSRLSYYIESTGAWNDLADDTPANEQA